MSGPDSETEAEEVLDLRSDDSSTTVRLWSLSDDALVEIGPAAGELTVVTRWGELTLENADAVVTESLRRMGFGPVSLRNTAASAADAAEPATAVVETLEDVFDRLGGVVVHSLGLPDGQGPLLSVVPEVSEPRFRPPVVVAERRMRLSRFATLRPAAGALVLEVPGAAFRVLLHRQPAQSVAAALAVPGTVAELAVSAGTSRPVVADLVSFLVGAGVLLVADEDGRFAEDTDPIRSAWSHHELLFHGHTRNGTGERLVDLRARGTLPGRPVTGPRPAGQRLPLSRPDLEALAATDHTLTALLETDQVFPRTADGELTADELGELLFRSARVRAARPVPIPPGAVDHDASQRPYVNIACLYELELYVTLHRCRGLPRGMYHYDPVGHALTLIDDDPDHVGSLLDVGRVAAHSNRWPAVLLTVTARMRRLSPVLAGASYAVALMHCGTLQETLFLAAKAMGLAAHAVSAEGGGAIDQLLGLRWPAEIGVGECIIEPER